MKLRLLLLVGSFTCVAVVWLLGQQTTQRLRSELTLAQDTTTELARLQAEHAKLLAAQPSAAEWEELHRTSALVTQLQRSIAARSSPEPCPAPAVAASPLAQSGQWVPAAEWQCRGRATSAHALETVFWAAARGEVTILRDAVVLAPDAHAKAKLLLATLPAAARATYPTPDDLAALFTARDAFFESVQLVHHLQRDPDHATDILLAQTADGKTKELTLVSYRNQSGQWRIIMPGAAIDRITAELTGVPRSAKPDAEPPRL